MKHHMNLKKEPFEKISNGEKTIELRLYDEKRRRVNIGDEIEFTSLENDADKIVVRVIKLHLFDSFEKLYEALPLEKCGYSKESLNEASASDMNAYYSSQEQAKYGAVGIEFAVEAKTLHTFDAVDLLNRICVENYDNGKRFTNARRLELIKEISENSTYRLICNDGLFHLYGKRELKDGDEILLVSTHIDCHPNIKKCYSVRKNDTMLCGTYDNSITNAAALKIMLEGEVSENVFFAFTGDEEFEAAGAIDLMEYLDKLNVMYQCIVLDVTDMGWNEEASFTVENNFWDFGLEKAVVNCAEQSGFEWKFVPSEPYNVPRCLDNRRLISEIAEPDESWTYDENDVECFSLCLPCKGNMHSDRGVEVKVKSYYDYIEVLSSLLKNLI